MGTHGMGNGNSWNGKWELMEWETCGMGNGNLWNRKLMEWELMEWECGKGMRNRLAGMGQRRLM